MNAARPSGVADACDRIVEPRAVEHRPAHHVARHADGASLHTQVVDGLDQTGAIDGEGVPGQQAGGVEAHEPGSIVGSYVGNAAMAVELGVAVLVVGDDARSRAPRRDHQRRAASALPAAPLASAAREVPATVPEEHGLERDPGTVRDAFDLAHVPRPRGPRRGFEGAHAIGARPLPLQRPEPVERGYHLPQGVRRRRAKRPADDIGITARGDESEMRAAHQPPCTSIRARIARASPSSWADSPSPNHCSDESRASRASSSLPARTHSGARSSTTRSSCTRAV